MMNLSKTVGYAVRALSCLEDAGGQPLFVQEIAKRTGLKKPYLARIINRLVHQGLIAAKRGYRGGVVLARPAGKIPLFCVVEALEGKNWSQPCFFGLDSCPAQCLCPAHGMWVDMRQRLENALRRTTLADLGAAVPPKRGHAPATLVLGVDRQDRMRPQVGLCGGALTNSAARK